MKEPSRCGLNELEEGTHCVQIQSGQALWCYWKHSDKGHAGAAAYDAAGCRAQARICWTAQTWR